ncbi:16S rRNA (guanine(966)-N(2))-methyltransferase RsmD [Rickettsiales bacterium LUAb2]
MRIIGGRYKGKKLLVNTDADFRPSSDRLKETLFNIINHYYKHNLVNQHVLDIYSGSGAIGLECISRLATSATLVEINKNNINLIYKNIPNNLSIEQQVKVINQDFLSTFTKQYNNNYSLVYIDPPYKNNLYLPTIKHLLSLDILNNKCLIITESLKEENIELNQFDKLKLQQIKVIGKSMLKFFQYFNN